MMSLQKEKKKQLEGSVAAMLPSNKLVEYMQLHGAIYYNWPGNPTNLSLSQLASLGMSSVSPREGRLTSGHCTVGGWPGRVCGRELGAHLVNIARAHAVYAGHVDGLRVGGQQAPARRGWHRVANLQLSEMAVVGRLETSGTLLCVHD